MTSLQDTACYQLITSFLKGRDTTTSPFPFNEETAEVELIVNEFVLKISPHYVGEESEPQNLILEVDLVLLNLEDKELNYQRFLFLHQLNYVTRFTTGIIATISERGMLSVNMLLPLKELTLNSLNNDVDDILKAAEELFALWGKLKEAHEATYSKE